MYVCIFFMYPFHASEPYEQEKEMAAVIWSDRYWGTGFLLHNLCTCRCV